MMLRSMVPMLRACTLAPAQAPQELPAVAEQRVLVNVKLEGAFEPGMRVQLKLRAKTFTADLKGQPRATLVGLSEKDFKPFEVAAETFFPALEIPAAGLPAPTAFAFTFYKPWPAAAKRTLYGPFLSLPVEFKVFEKGLKIHHEVTAITLPGQLAAGQKPECTLVLKAQAPGTPRRFTLAPAAK